MRTVLPVALLCAAAAAADELHDIRFYFSLQGTVDTLPNEYVTQTNPTAQVGQTVYLWMTTYAPDVCIGIGLRFDAAAPGWVTTAGEIYNTDFAGWGHRWEGGSDFDPSGTNDITIVGITTKGVGSDGDPLAYWEALGGGDYLVHSLLGELTMTADSPADVRLATSTFTAMKNLPERPDIYMGFGDPPVPQWQQWADSELPDLYIVPEPAAFALLVPAILLLRRR